MYLARHADALRGEVEQSALTGGVIVEASSLGKALLQYADGSLYPSVPLPAILSVRESAEIPEALSELVDDLDGWRERSTRCQTWVEYVIQRPLDRILELLDGRDRRGDRPATHEAACDVS